MIIGMDQIKHLLMIRKLELDQNHHIGNRPRMNTNGTRDRKGTKLLVLIGQGPLDGLRIQHEGKRERIGIFYRR